MRNLVIAYFLQMLYLSLLTIYGIYWLGQLAWDKFDAK